MNLNEQQKISLIVALFAGAVGLLLIVFFHFMVGRDMIKGFDQQTVKKNADLTEIKAQLSQIEETINQEDELKKQKQTIDKATRRLPSSPDAPGFLTALVKILGTTGIIQEEVKPDTVANNGGALYTEIPYKIKAQGHYHAFGQFLTLIEQNPDRFMRIKNMKISNNIERPSIHPIEMDIATFMFNKQ